MSLGTPGSSDGNDVVSMAINRAAEAGIVPVVAAGNAGPGPRTIGSPAAAEKAITIAAMADVDRLGFGLAAFSSRGPTRDGRVKPDISGPGVGIMAPRAGSGNQYIAFSGTSMATPYVSGAVALLLHARPALTVEQVRSILQTTARDWGLSGKDVDYGWGRLDIHAAVKLAGNLPGGTPPVVPGHLRYSGSLAGPGTQAEHSFTLTDPAFPLNVTLVMPGWSDSASPDFDLHVYLPDGSELGRSAGSNRQEQVAKAVAVTGRYRVTVTAHSGGGEYIVDVSGGIDGRDDKPPSVAVVQPVEGATVSGTVPVRIHAADDVRVERVELSVNGGAYSNITHLYDGSHYTYPWNTAPLENGAHTLTARATDSSGQNATASRSVVVANDHTPPGAEHQVSRTGVVSAGARERYAEVSVYQPGYVDLSLSWGGTADLDFYVYAPDGSFVGRAYTLNNPERLRVDTVQWGTGTYRIRVHLYSGQDTAFTLTARGYQEVRYTGSVSPTARDSSHTRMIYYSGKGRAVLSWPGSADLDFYVYDSLGEERARAYTLRNPEITDIDFVNGGEWRVRVNLYSGPGVAYALSLFIPEAVLS
jgi:hypothetical protein